MHFIQKTILLSTASLVLCSCEQEVISPRDYPRVEIEEIVIQDDNGASFEALFLSRAGEISDKGFVLDYRDVPFINQSWISAGSGYGDGSFTATTSLNLINGMTYHVRAYAQSGEQLIYSREITFLCDNNACTPVLTSVSPTHGIFGDTVEISGRNLSFTSYQTTVSFGDIPATITECSDTSIHALVPLEIDYWKVPVIVQTIGKEFVAPQEFELNIPEIDSISPDYMIYPYENLTIHGRNFNPKPGLNQVFIGDSTARVLETSAISMKIEITNRIALKPGMPYVTLPVTVEVAGRRVTSSDSIQFRQRDVPVKP